MVRIMFTYLTMQSEQVFYKEVYKIVGIRKFWVGFCFSDSLRHKVL
jgi:hypothetical protein